MNSETLSKLMEQWETENGPVQTQSIRVSELPKPSFVFAKPKKVEPTKANEVLAYNRRHPKATVQEIAAELSMDVDYARSVLNAHHIKTPLKKRDRQESSQRIITRNYLKNHPGEMTKDIASHLGISPTVIRTVAREMGYELSRPKSVPRPSPLKDKVVFELQNSDASDITIAEKIGCTTEYVRRSRRELLESEEL